MLLMFVFNGSIKKHRKQIKELQNELQSVKNLDNDNFKIIQNNFNDIEKKIADTNTRLSTLKKEVDVKHKSDLSNKMSVLPNSYHNKLHSNEKITSLEKDIVKIKKQLKDEKRI